jgi:hypothetical protein
MRRLHRLLALLALALAAASALAQTQEGRLYTPGAFDRIEIDGAAKVTLTQGERDQVFIAGDDDAQRSVMIERSGRSLEIRPTGGWKFWKSAKLQIDIQLRQVSQIDLSGATDLHAPGPVKTDRLVVRISGAGLARFDALTTGQLKFDISGAGDGQLAGQVDELSLNVSGKSKVVAEQLRAARAKVSISGLAVVSLWVTDKLQVDTSGVGTVDYWGQPEVKRSTSGLASINSRGDKH